MKFVTATTGHFLLPQVHGSVGMLPCNTAYVLFSIPAPSPLVTVAAMAF